MKYNYLKFHNLTKLNFTGIVQKAMEGTQNHFKISLPLPVALGSGKTWADLQ